MDVVADGLIREHGATGLAMGVHGPWGSGKSSILNFVRQEIQERRGDKVVIVDFNPWWFGARQGLTASVLLAFERTLGMDHLRNARTLIDKYATLLAPIPQVGSSLEKLAHAVKPSDDAFAIRTELGNKITESQKRILLLVDDVDRLLADELITLFGLIKGMADLPHVDYLVAFDRQAVVDQLRARGIDAERFLEKILQVTFDIPRVQDSSLRTMFHRRLPEGLAPLGRDPGWLSLYRASLAGLLTTPRAVVRLASSLHFTYPRLEPYVNAADFACLEAVRLFEPAVYGAIRERPEMFLNPEQSGPGVDQFHDRWVKAVREDHRRLAVTLIVHLFPSLSTLGAIATMEPTQVQVARSERRMNDPKCIWAYLNLFPSATARTASRLEATILGQRGSHKTFSDEFGRALSVSRDEDPQALVELLEMTAKKLDKVANDDVAYDVVDGVLKVGAASGLETPEGMALLIAIFNKAIAAGAVNRKGGERLLKLAERELGKGSNLSFVIAAATMTRLGAGQIPDLKHANRIPGEMRQEMMEFVKSNAKHRKLHREIDPILVLEWWNLEDPKSLRQWGCPLDQSDERMIDWRRGRFDLGGED